MLSLNKRWREAVPHYERAARLLAQQRPDLQGEELEPRIASGLQAASAHR
jgi:hypothetical protein